MQWIEVTIKTAPGAIDLVCDRLTVLGFDSFIVDDQDQFHEFLEENRQYWDYVDEGLEQQMQGLSQIRLYLEEGPAVPETISHLKDQLAALRAQYPATDFGSLDVQHRLRRLRPELRTGKTTGSSITSRCPSAKSCWSCPSGCTRKTRSTASRSCSTPA